MKNLNLARGINGTGRDTWADYLEDSRTRFRHAALRTGPGEPARALHEGELMPERDGINLSAVHPGGQSILDSVEKGLDLPTDALAASREVLSCFGNMSSATVMFVLQRMMQQARSGQLGCAISFGPGLTEETMRFHVV